jgi:hypothetical protein
MNTINVDKTGITSNVGYNYKTGKAEIYKNGKLVISYKSPPP